VFGTEQERALRSGATAAIEVTARDLQPADKERAEQVALVIDQVFNKPRDDLLGERQDTWSPGRS
jgi:hypothetical protein